MVNNLNKQTSKQSTHKHNNNTTGIEACLLCVYEKVRNLPGEQTWTPPTLSIPSIYHLPSDFQGKLQSDNSLTLADLQRLQQPRFLVYKTQLPVLENLLFPQSRTTLLCAVLTYFVECMSLLSDSTNATFCALCAK